MTDLSSRIAGLSAKKQALLAQRLRAEPKASALASIPRREGEGPVRLSFAQERLWFLDRWQPGNAAYNLLDAIRLVGPLDVPALAAALAEVERRHESLRTVFVESGGVPYQVATSAAAQSLPLIDLAALPPGLGLPAAQAFAQAEGRVPFDMARGPLWRARLLRLGDEEHFLVLVMHHAVTDLWSFGIFIRELGTLYNRTGSGDAPLPELPIQYPDFAVWQRGRLAGELLEHELAFWRQQLEGAPVSLDLPTDRPRPAVQGFAGALLPFTLPSGLLASLKALAQEANGTLFMAAWAAFSVLLSRYSGQRDLLLGSVLAGRTRREVEPLIGLFVNTVVLRADLSGDPSFLDLLARARETVLEAFAHQDLPFEKLVEELQQERDPSRAPLVQVLFALQNAPVRPLALHGLTFTPYLFDTGTAKLDLSLFLTEEDGALLGALEYSTELFDAARIERLAGHLRELLTGIATDPGRRLSELPLLSSPERRQLIADWNDTVTAYPPVTCLHHLFEAQADRSPEAVAVRFEERTLTYRELDLASNRLAHRLQAHGVGPEVVVGVLLDRSLEMVVALFGVLKAGGAYLPLDPSYPVDRLSAFVEDATPRLVLTVSALAHLVPAGTGVVFLDTDREAATGPDASRPRSPAGPDSLAYVIFTSGSTGRPKGAMNAHRGIVNRILWMQEAYGLGADDRVLQKTPFSFDVSVWEFFWPLAVGARLVLAKPGGHRDPAYLVDLIAGEGITTLHFVPSMLQAFLEAQGLERCASIRRVITSGEELTAEVAARCLDRLGWAELHNLYGPTEAAVDVTAWPCRRGELGARVPIGRPIANLRIHLLDAWEPVPIGVPGELFIGGVGVGRGYLGRPALTAERFVPDPLSPEPGGRLYRTGDLARHRPGGAVDFLGRVDHQVKIRGFRIELGEIEAVLSQIPGVKAAVVGVREARGDRQLVAYLAVDGATAPARGELRELLRSRLPEAMVPAAFVLLDALPLNPNGKVDRKALSRLEPEVDRRLDARDRTPLQELVADIWGEVLGLERLGLEESFFELGGHSLLATRVISRVRETFGLELSLPAFFEAPTVAGLATRIEELTRSGGTAVLPPLAPVPRSGPLPLSFAQERLWFLDRLEPGSHAYNIADALAVEGAFDVTAFAASLREIVCRHEALRTTFRLGPEGAEQVIAPPEAAPDLPVVDLTALPEAVRERVARRLAEEEAVRPFDLAKGPLLRVALARLAPERALLLCNMHHIVSDGWSMGVFFRELATLYEAFASRRRPVLPELPVQYADYAVWQRSWLQGEVLAGELAHWRSRLAGAPPVLELPWDRPRSAAGRRRSASLDLVLAAALAGAVHALGRRERATLFMTLLSSFAALLHRLSGQEDLSIGTPVAGRGQLEIEGLIGFFVNTLVIRSQAAGDLSFRGLLGQVRDATLDAYQHQDLPFEKLVEELQPQRSLEHSPLFQVMFVLQNAPLGDEGVRLGTAAEPSGSVPALRSDTQLIDRAVAERLIGQFEMPGLRLSPMPLGTNEVPFDLVLTLLEHGHGIVGTLGYDAQLLEAATAERLLRQWRTILAAGVDRPDAAWSELPLLGHGERQQVLVEWSDTDPAAGLPPVCLHELFAAQAARTPEAEALVCGEERLSYGALDRRSAALAERLRARGVGPEVVVAVCAERSAVLVVALLGILRAGGAYVPLDPAYPRERLELMLEDSGAAALLVSRRFAAEVAEWASGRVAVLDLDELARGAAAPAEVGSGVGPDNVAYLIYTSGSTGRPKGVAIEHRSAAALARWAREVFDDEDFRGVLFSTSINFDLSIFELFVPLASGGRVILADNALALPSLPAAGEVTLVNTVPSALAELAREGRLPRAVRTVNLAGEPLPRDLADRIYGLPGVERLFNLYGPSEDTTYSTWVQVPREGGKPSIGRPVAGTRAYVLDRWGQPAPVGAFGELFLGGAGLARGYWRRPDLTAERFVPDPFGNGERLYRTGDLVRFWSDGQIEFLGRIDRQVKVRGFRIELGEIEAALAAHPGVREAAVLVQDREGDRRLAAWLVAEPGAIPAPDELRQHLRAKLPDHMIPSAFRFLEALPLTPNGKVDRQALARLAPQPTVAGGPVAPRTPLEQMVAEIWAEVLRSAPEGIGAVDDFFLLGGHSLLATQVVSRVASTFGVEVPLRLLFERPTLAGFAEGLEEALLGGERPALPAIARAPRHEPLPLSFAQERLWFLDRLEPGSTAYNLPGALRIEGDLDVAALAGSLDAIVRRHEVLRTVFVIEDGMPRQRVLPAAAFALPVVDLSALDPQRYEAGVRELAAAEVTRPFDLSAGPLLRVVLLRLAPARHVVLFDMHHVASDGWSMGVFVRELAALYPAFAVGRPAPLGELPVQYGDFAVWQRRWLGGEELARQLAYWRERLAGVPPMLELPTDRPRPTALTRRAARRTVALPPDLAGSVRALGRRARATLFMTLLAGFEALLHRLSGQDDLCVGTPIAGRRRRELEGLIGFFVNTLVLRSEASDDATGEEQLARVRESTLGAFCHQDLPFERLVEELHPERNRSHAPVFQVMFTLQNATQDELELPGLTCRPLEVGSGGAKFDLLLTCWEQGEEITGSFEYNADLFDEATLERWAGSLTTLLAALAAAPQQRLSELPLLSPAQRHQVLREWTPVRRELPAGACLHDLVAAQAVRTPEGPAVSFEGSVLTYRQLDEQANRLARHLRARGVGPDVLVGLCVERSLEMVIGMLGVLKAGGAYVPLDPAFPRAHLALVLEEMRPALVLSQEAWLADLPVSREDLFLLDADAASLAVESAEALVSGVAPENLAYVIYTSGSTGRPKGVMLPHRAITNHLLARQALHPMGPTDSFLQQAAFSFEMSVWEIFWPLIAGARLVLARPGGQRDAAYLVETVAAAEIGFLRFTPSMLAVVADQAGVERCRALRHVYTGAEPLAPDLAERFGRLVPGSTVHHLYGPTETCVAASLFVGEPRPSSPKLPIGRSLAGADLYVADRGLAPVPPGVAGELYVGGMGVARGYLGRPELTAERFVPHPWSELPGRRLYRTGDLVRWLPDGNLDFIGRVDHQVKIRGFRVELGEIEAVLAQMPGVREAAVLVRAAGGERQVVAYVAGSASTAELRHNLQARLPEYMVPSWFVTLEALPRTRNGKVDRRALAEIEPAAGPTEERAGVPPRDEVELALLEVWEEVLGRRGLGTGDGFFDVGGHSLLGVRLLARIQQRFGRTLPLSALFESSTIERQAALLRGADAGHLARPLVAISPQGAEAPLFCVHPIGGNVLCYRDLAKALGQRRPFYGLQSVPGGPETVEGLAARYLEEVRDVQPRGPYALAGWSMGALVAFEMARQLRARGEEVALLALLDPPPVPSAATPGLYEPELGLLESFGLDLAGLGYADAVRALRERLTDEELEASLAEGGDAGGLDVDLSPWRRLYGLYRTNAAAMRSYRPGPYAGPLALFLCADDPSAVDPRGWEGLAAGRCEVHPLAGDHYSILRPPAVARLAELLNARLERDSATSAGADRMLSTEDPGEGVAAAGAGFPSGSGIAEPFGT